MFGASLWLSAGQATAQAEVAAKQEARAEADSRGRILFLRPQVGVGWARGDKNSGNGTLGYIGVGSTDRNPFGLVTNLGWQPEWDSRALPFITLRTEWIFDQVVFNVLSLSVGVAFGI